MHKKVGLLGPVALVCFAGTAHAQLLVENFDNMLALEGQGWTIVNSSTPPLTNPGWFQGNPAVWEAHQGSPEAWAASNWARTAGLNGTETLSTWMITPVLTVTNGTTINFWTRTVDGGFYPDRMQVRLSTLGASSVIPAEGEPEQVGSFTNLLLDINPNLTTTGYPFVWTEYNVPITGLSGPTPVRIAFRYYVHNGGWNGVNSNYVGVDTLTVTAGTGGGCYANCDNSTQPPILNVADFSCFLTKFAAQDPYANCDGSTVAPVHNVADFSCFLTKFAGGC